MEVSKRKTRSALEVRPLRWRVRKESRKSHGRVCSGMWATTSSFIALVPLRNTVPRPLRAGTPIFIFIFIFISISIFMFMFMFMFMFILLVVVIVVLWVGLGLGLWVGVGVDVDVEIEIDIDVGVEL